MGDGAAHASRRGARYRQLTQLFLLSVIVAASSVAGNVKRFEPLEPLVHDMPYGSARQCGAQLI